MLSKDKAVVLLSGGMDSTTLLAYLLSEGKEVFPISIHYGQRHSREIGHAAMVCSYYGLNHKAVDLKVLKDVLTASCLTDESREVPEGHYADENMKATVVPNRNMIMLSVAAGYAISVGAFIVALANHKGDHTIYPDCRPEFISAIDQCFKTCHFEPVQIVAPFTNYTKADICGIAHRLDAPLNYTWSCYKGGEHHCGKCGTCVERIEAFKDAGVQDPTRYEE